MGTSDANAAEEPVDRAISLLEGKWTLRIVRALLEGNRGFNDLARAVGGCNTATLSRRLEALVAEGVVDKKIESTMPPRTCYSLTACGRALEEVIVALARWSEKRVEGAS